jgi:hypothetical protein
LNRRRVAIWKFHSRKFALEAIANDREIEVKFRASRARSLNTEILFSFRAVPAQNFCALVIKAK